MVKKLGLSCFLVAMLLVQVISGIAWTDGNSGLVANATEVCTTEEECQRIIDSRRRDITDLEEEGVAVREEIIEIEADIDEMNARINQTEAAIQTVESNIIRTQQNIERKEVAIVDSEAELVRLDEEIKGLNELIADRMRMTQRWSRNNLPLEMLARSESFIELVRGLRMMSHLAQNDADLMTDLNDLTAQQQGILVSLQEQKEELAAERVALAEQQEVLEVESAQLAGYQAQLAAQQSVLESRLSEIEAAMLTAEEAIDIAREQQEVIANTPPPVVTTPPPAPQAPPATTPAPGGSSSAGNNASQTPPATIPGGQMFIIPLERGRVTCEFMCYPQHTGIDLGNFGDTSTRVLAAADGVVFRSGWHNMFGNHVMITHNIDGQIFTTVYAHLHQTPFVSVGQTVTQGQVLGTMGNTGNSFGAHLHFEIYVGPFNWPHARNPRDFIHFPPSW